jgi:hypothetical protein
MDQARNIEKETWLNPTAFSDDEKTFTWEEYVRTRSQNAARAISISSNWERQNQTDVSVWLLLRHEKLDGRA